MKKILSNNEVFKAIESATKNTEDDIAEEALLVMKYSEHLITERCKELADLGEDDYIDLVDYMKKRGITIDEKDTNTTK